MKRLTGHALKRLKNRAGLPKHKLEALVEQAWNRGLQPHECPARIRDYIATIDDGAEYRVWHGLVFIFNPGGACLTAYALPGHRSDRPGDRRLDSRDRPS